MKNRLLYLFFLFGIFLLSCRGDEVGIPKIDQVLQLYISENGKDALNTNIPGAYRVDFNDVYGTKDVAPVSFSTKKDADTVTYIEYVAGAKRILTDSLSPTNRYYQSKIALKLTQQPLTDPAVVVHDTLVLNYHYTDIDFQISEAFYNGTKVFTKILGEPNVIKIVK